MTVCKPPLRGLRPVSRPFTTPKTASAKSVRPTEAHSAVEMLLETIYGGGVALPSPVWMAVDYSSSTRGGRVWVMGRYTGCGRVGSRKCQLALDHFKSTARSTRPCRTGFWRKGPSAAHDQYPTTLEDRPQEIGRKGLTGKAPAKAVARARQSCIDLRKCRFINRRNTRPRVFVQSNIAPLEDPPATASAIYGNLYTRRAFSRRNFSLASGFSGNARACWAHFSSASIGKFVPKSTLSCP
jgi:hypothetical protein